MQIQAITGYLPDQYSKHAPEEYRKEGVPVCSLPIELEDLPKGTKDLAVVFIDYDAVPVCGFPFIHWLATGFGAVTNVPEDAARLDKSLCQGSNSFSSKFYPEHAESIVQGYAGPMPPDKDHNYTLTVYALDQKLDLSKGFYLNELLKAMDGHVLAQASEQVLAKA
ncbi:YbhB/YbcL family Raf kinase inhibitor-like protein [Fructobacillus sp. M1-13]|uniref:YbhB/YbcL family Raf kinase inhibitor-like protein n=1 Tax=Fructobacillus papyriferae TaxID=2713171 RepID=A0ABS5QP27_9LACO|nr:YbhB/YbcL family Raf kinase inhibitor-like protein [Fructobacillus papyriferae]MBS9334627.1 YbhB/YbcL family Raf kinase inhibitor-like protein [Fructobacillus papyriferae]MCD2158617.1 YbhB/YbcL family Raf kinase inhibitor-like protein [Fructobacillus papyriferae]